MILVFELNFQDTLAQLSGLWQLEQDNEVRFVTLLKPGSINLCKCNWPADLARVRTSNKLFTKTFHEGRWWSTWLFRLNLFSWLGPEAAKMIIYKEEEFGSINLCLFRLWVWNIVADNCRGMSVPIFITITSQLNCYHTYTTSAITDKFYTCDPIIRL